jgi:short-subunit dehydrogenase
MKNVLVLGASGDIGRSLVQRLVNAGYRVVGTFCSTVVQEFTQVEMIHLDVTDAESFKRGLGLLKNNSFDIIVNCLGIAEVGPLEEMTDQRIYKSAQINFMAPVSIFRDLMPMLDAKSGAKFIHLSTFVAESSPLQLSLYASTKAAFDSFLACMSKEVQNVQITNIVLGPVHSKMLDKIMNTIGGSKAHALRQRFFKKMILKYTLQTPDHVSSCIFDIINMKKAPVTVQVLEYNSELRD